jgi:hypothetical protein
MTRPSLRGAIDAFCKHCLYDPGNGNGAWREQIEACTSSSCPLFQVRPRSSVRAVSAPENAAPEPTPAEGAANDELPLGGEGMGLKARNSE